MDPSIFYSNLSLLTDMNIIINLFICFFYVFASVNLGAALLVCLRIKPTQRVSSSALLATAFLLGQTGLVAVWTGLGLLALFSLNTIRVILIIYFLGGLIFAWPLYRTTLISLWTKVQIFRNESVIWKIILLLVLILIGLEGIAAFVAPPVGDAEAFYLPIAKVLAASENLVPLIGYESFSQVGLFGEIHFAALISLSSLEAAKMFVWFTALATAMILMGLGSQIGLKHRGQLLVLAMLFTSSTFYYYISDGKVDLFAAALGLVAYYWALQFENIENNNIIALIGLFAGMSVIAKLSYLLVILPSVFIIIFWRYFATANHERSIKKKIISFIMIGMRFAFWFALASLPNIIKNTALFSQPFAPFLMLDGSANTWLDQTWFSPGVTRHILLTYPFALIFGQYPMQGGGLSPILLILLPFILFLPKSNFLPHSKSFQLGVAALAGIILWNMFRASAFAPRYILATLLLFVPIIACAAETYLHFESKPRWLSAMLLFCIVSMLLLNFVERRNYVAPRWEAYVVKGEITCISPNCIVWRKANKVAKPGDRIFLADYYRFWLRSDLLQCIASPSEVGLALSTPPEERWGSLFELGIQYVIVNEETHSNIAKLLDLNAVPEWLNVKIKVQEGAYSLLSLKALDPSRQPKYSCEQKNYPAWKVSFSQ